MNDAFASAIDALFADPNVNEDALWKAGLIGAAFAASTIRRLPVRKAEIRESPVALPALSVDIRRREAATIMEDDLSVICSETHKSISELKVNAGRLVLVSKAVTI